MSGNIWVCEKHLWKGARFECPMCEEDRLKEAVYDAAMALFEDGDGMIVTDSYDEPDASGTIYSSAKKIAALWEARCRAKEGHG